MTIPELETIQEVADTEEDASLNTSETRIELEVPEKVGQNEQLETNPKILP